MNKRVSICVIIIAILLVFAGCLYIMPGNYQNQNEQGNVQIQSGQEDAVEQNEPDDAWHVGEASESAIESMESTGEIDDSDKLNANDSMDSNDSGDSENSEVSASAEINSSAKYVILARNGTLVVFYSADMTEYFDTGIDVMSLPDETIDQVVAGISFVGEEELFAFLESYSS